MPPSDPTEIDDLLDLGISRAFGAPGRDGELAPLLAELAAVPGSVAESPPDEIGRFRVLGIIAQGGMGIVVRAQDPDFERDVAIKYMRRSAAAVPALQQLFRGEARVMGQLQHPGIVPIHELGTMADGRLFYVMKIVAGESLQAILARVGRGDLDRGDAVTFFLRMCEAVAFAHDRGVVHGDLKPANVMVGAFGEVQVLDWGFARACADAAASASGSPEHGDAAAPRVLGTPGYMAPEQARGTPEAIDRRTDVFALGSILCEILTGAPAYRGATRDEVYLRARRVWLDDAFSRLQACTADLALVELARACLVEVQAERPAHAGVVAAAVHDHLAASEQRARDAALAAARARARAEEERKARRMTLALSVVIILALLGGVAAVWLVQAPDAGLRADAGRRADDARQRVLELRDLARVDGAGVEHHWVEASAVAREAETLAQDPHLSPDVAERLRELRRQVETEASAALRDGRARRLLETTQPHLGEDRPIAEVESGYRTLLAVFGVDADRDEPDAVARAIRTSPLTREVAQALHRWSHARRGRGGGDASSWQRLLQLADQIDADPWRTTLRRCCGERDREALRALAEEPGVGAQRSESLGLLAECLLSVGDRDAAIDTYRVAHLQHPGDYVIVHDLAVLLERGSPRPVEEIVRLFTAALALRPDDPHALVDLAAAFTEHGLLPAARALAERAQALDPEYPRLWLMLTNLRDLGGDAAGALAAARKAVELLPRSGMAHLLVAKQERAAGRHDAARAACEQAVALAPRLAAAHRALGVALMDDGRLGAAVASLRQASELDPTDAQIWYHLGLCHSVVLDFPAAEAAYTRAFDLEPDYAEALCNLGSVQASTGRFDEALASVRRGVEAGAKSPRWEYPTGRWIAAIEHRQRQVPAFEALLARGDLPADAAVCADLAGLSVARGANSLALRLCAAAAAGGEGNRVPYIEVVRAAAGIAAGRDLARSPNPDERAEAARTARSTLQAVLQQLRAAASAGAASESAVRRSLSTWELSPELASLRAEESLAALGGAEAASWREFWVQERSLAREYGLD